MTAPPISLLTLCILGIVYVALSIAVGVERGRLMQWGMIVISSALGLILAL